MRKHAIIATLLSGAAAVSAAPGAFAQAPAAAAAAGQPDGTPVIEEIVVTAQKRAENVQDIPKSVQVVTPRELAQSNVTQISDLRNLVPSISGTGLSMRGVATSASTVGAQNKVGYIVDDVPQISRAVTLNQLVDVERVEVLPGPQGTLSGRNATGGLINIVTRGPSNTFTGNAQVTGTTDRQLTASVFLAGPLTDTLSFSVSGYHDYFRGLYKNITVNKWLSRQTDGVRAKLRWKPSDKLTLLGTFVHERNVLYGDVEPAAQIFEFAPPSTYFALDFARRIPFATLVPGVVPSKSNNEYAAPGVGRAKANSNTAILKADYDLGPATLTYVGSHFQEKRPQTSLFVPVPLQYSNLPVGDGYAHILSGVNYDTQELRISSPTNDRLSYIAGVIYTNNKNTFNYQRVLFGPVNWNRTFNTEATAGYGHVGFRVIDPVTLTGGVRYESDTSKYNWHFLPTTANADLTSANSSTDRYWNYDFGAQVRPAEGIMFYATYAQASQGKIFNAESNVAALAGPLQPLPSEHVSDIEGGVKTTLFDNRLRFNVNVFSSRYRNYQVNSIILDQSNPASVPTLLLSSIGRVRTRGLEVTSTFAATRSLRLDLAAAYTDARILDFPNAPCFTGQTTAQGCVLVKTGSTQKTQGNLAGVSLANAPKWKVVATSTYTHPIGVLGADLELAGTVRYQSRQITDQLQDPNTKLSPYAVVNLSAGLKTSRWSAQLFVNNLFDSGGITTSTAPFLFSTPPTDTPARTHTLNRDVNRYGGIRLGVNF